MLSYIMLCAVVLFKLHNLINEYILRYDISAVLYLKTRFKTGGKKRKYVLRLESANCQGPEVRHML